MNIRLQYVFALIHTERLKYRDTIVIIAIPNVT